MSFLLDNVHASGYIALMKTTNTNQAGPTMKSETTELKQKVASATKRIGGMDSEIAELYRQIAELEGSKASAEMVRDDLTTRLSWAEKREAGSK